ncbi:MAG: hypothetical protein ACTSW7_03730 [Candidatus Thorarchaeota archaeon]
MNDSSIKCYLEALDDIGKEIIDNAKARKDSEFAIIQQEKEDFEKSKEDKPFLSPANWIENEYYAGEFVWMWDGLKEEFIRICDSGVFELVIGGAIGGGKSTLVRALQKRTTYLLSRHHDPHSSFFRRLIPTSPIVMLNLNVTKDKAKRAYFSEFSQSIRTTPYFKQEFAPQANVLNELRFPKNIICGFSGASKTAAESENLFFLVLDEANLYEDVEKSRKSDEGERYDEAAVVHMAGLRRMESRFMHPDTGEFPEGCMLITVCRETYKDSFVRRRMKEIKDAKLDVEVTRKDGTIRKPIAMCLEWAQWQYWPDSERDREWFWISVPTPTEAGEVIEKEDEMKKVQKKIDRRIVEKINEPGQIIKVPKAGGRFIDSARSNLEGFIREICGIPTEAINIFIRDKRIIANAIRVSSMKYRDITNDTKYLEDETFISADTCIHPFNYQTLDFSFGDVTIEEKRICTEEVKEISGEEYIEKLPIMFPDEPRYIHIDVGLTGDAAGIAIGCKAGWKVVQRIGESGFEEVLAPVTWIDLMARIVPPKGGKIKFAWMIGLIKKLIKCGYNFDFATADGFQSAMLLEFLEDEYGIPSEVLSVDRTTDPYFTLRTQMQESRLFMYEYEPFIDEARTLEVVTSKKSVDGMIRMTEKVEHPPKKSKDVADGVAGVCFHVETKSRSNVVSSDMISSSAIISGSDLRKNAERKHTGEREMRKAMKEGKFEKVFKMFGGR